MVIFMELNENMSPFVGIEVDPDGQEWKISWTTDKGGRLSPPNVESADEYLGRAIKT